MKAFLIIVALVALGCSQAAVAQSSGDLLARNRAFKGAEATRPMYHAIYQLDDNDPTRIQKTIRNINNALDDLRLSGRLQIELIAYSGGTDAYLKGSKYGSALKRLVQRGVIVAQCANTLKERKISRNQIHDFIAVVPTGNGELIIRQAEGWSVVKP